MALHTQWDRPDRTLLSVIGHGCIRPVQIFAFEPIVQVLAAYMAVIYGVMYLLLATFPQLWSEKYGESAGIGGLHYIALAIGFTIGAQVRDREVAIPCFVTETDHPSLVRQAGSRVLDRSYAYQKKRNGGVGTPEMRMPLLVITSFFIPIGLFIYGWSAHYKTHWIVPDIGVCIFCIGAIGAMMPIQTYIVDNFMLQAASALAAASAIRSLAGFGFPLFADAMFSKLGYGECTCISFRLRVYAARAYDKFLFRLGMQSPRVHCHCFPSFSVAVLSLWPLAQGPQPQRCQAACCQKVEATSFSRILFPVRIRIHWTFFVSHLH